MSSSIVALLAAGCTGDGITSRVDDATSDAPVVRDGTTAAAPRDAIWRGTTPPSGNRAYDGAADLSVSPVEVTVTGTPAWIVGAPTADGSSVWAIVAEDGTVTGFTVDGSQVAGVDLGTTRVDAAGPPVLIAVDGVWQLLTPPEDASSLTSPVVVADGRVAYVTADGDLIVGTDRLALDLLPDTRLSLRDDGRIVALAQRTSVYDHGVLGDPIEAGAVVVVDVLGTPEVVETLVVTALADGTPQVIEGTAAIVADLGGGSQQILVTVSSDAGGADVQVDATSDVATGAIGLGGRWRHVIGVAPGPDGTPRVVEVVTPHLGRRVQFLAVTEDGLVPVAAGDGLVASHLIRRRNLDQAALVQFADGAFALVGPDATQRALVAVRENGDRAEVVTTLPLPAPWATNLGVVQRRDGRTDLAIGMADGTVRIWVAPR